MFGLLEQLKLKVKLSRLTGLDYTGLDYWTHPKCHKILFWGREQVVCAYLAPNFTKFASLAC